MSKNKKDKQFYSARAKTDFKSLVIYWNVTRPRYVPYYKVDGKFRLEELDRQMDFLKKWDNRPSDYKRSHAKIYSEYSKNFNYTFGIPNDLVERVLGRYRDDDNKRVSIKVKDIVSQLEEEGFLKVCNHGTKTKKDENGKHKVKCFWFNKYLMANVQQWYSLMKDNRYSKIETFPNVSDRIVGYVLDYNKSLKKEKERKEDMNEEMKVEPTNKVEQTKVVDDTNKVEQTKKVNLTREDVESMIDSRNPATFDTLKRMYETGIIDEPYFISYAMYLFKKSKSDLASIPKPDPKGKPEPWLGALSYGLLIKTLSNTPGIDEKTYKALYRGMLKRKNEYLDKLMKNK